MTNTLRHLVREINKDIIQSAFGGSPHVMYSGPHSKHPARLMDCRSRKGVLQVRFLSTGVWVKVTATDKLVCGSSTYTIPI